MTTTNIELPSDRENLTAAGSESSRILRTLSEGKGIPLDQLVDHLEEVSDLIRAGQARLRIVVQPWGLEYFVVATHPAQTK